MVKTRDIPFLMRDRISPTAPCHDCLHYFRLDFRQHCCIAFRSGIPFDILNGSHDHKTIHPRQVGSVVWKKHPDY